MAAKLTVIKAMDYRGVAEEWSNTYHFDGGAPSDQTKWLTLDNAVRAAEKLVLPPFCSIVRTIGYTADDTPAEWLRSFITTGTFAIGTGEKCPGDSAVWIRYDTARRDSRGHPVYLRNYYHACLHAPGAPDFIYSSQQAALSTYAQAWIAGFSDGTQTHKRTGPDSLGATGHGVSTYIARRKLKRRG